MRLIFLGVVFWVLCGVSFAQVLDDSTKQIYGTKTTRYVLEEDILNNRYHKVVTDTQTYIMQGNHKIDTVLNGLQNYRGVMVGKQHYQDLGNYLSPKQSVYYEQATEIGKRFGFGAFDAYTIDPNKVKYYDTKSPFSKLEYIQGTKGQHSIAVEFSRNIKKNWNAGFDFRRLTSRKILGATNAATGATEQKLQSSDYILSFYTRYYTPNERYQLLVNLTHAHQVNFDNGGIKYSKTNPKDSIFEYELAPTYLSSARTIDKRYNWHAFQEYSLNSNKTLQIYHSIDFQKRTTRFTNLFVNSPSDTAFYTAFPLSIANPTKDTAYNFTSMLVQDQTDFELLENKAGLKGTAGKLDYRIYYRRKDFSYKQLYYTQDSIPYNSKSVNYGPADSTPVNNSFVENFVGARLNYQLNPNFSATVDGEYLLGNDYRYSATIQSKLLHLGYAKIYHSPTLLQLTNRSNLKALSWNYLGNDGKSTLQNMQSDKLFLELMQEGKKWYINPGVRYEMVRNYIYFDSLATPNQSKEGVDFLSADLAFKVHVGNVFWESYSRYTKASNEQIVHIPLWYTTNRVYVQSNIFKKAALIQVGIDTYWRSTYKANAYMPITQQFYLNNNSSQKNYLLVDLFLNAQIKNASIFLKASHLNQWISSTTGYYTTPTYSGLPGSFDFGIRWFFFD